MVAPPHTNIPVPIHTEAAWALPPGAPTLEVTTQVGAQTPAAQERPVRQLLPQPPQCSFDVAASMQVPAQSVWVPGHPPTHAPPEQVLPGSQSIVSQQAKQACCPA